jgi:hypothetical protein
MGLYQLQDVREETFLYTVVGPFRKS